MKKLLQLLTALLMLLALVGCDMFGSDAGSDSDGDTDVPSLTSTWFIKGTFDGWAGADEADIANRNFFTKDEINANLLTFKISDLGALQTAFVIVDPDLKEWKAPNDDFNASATPITFIYRIEAEKADQADAIFIPTKDAYTVTVDISDVAAPIVTIATSSETDAEMPTLLEHTDAIIMKGSLFDNGWADIAPTSVVDNVLTWDDVTIETATGEFMFNSLEGGLKGITVVSPIAGTPVVAGLIAGGNNIVYSGGANIDDVYTVSIAIDLTATTVAEKYTLTVTLKTAGTLGWPVIDVAYLSSKLNIMGDLFTIGWTATAGVADAALSTVTFDVTVGAGSSFGYESYDGFLKGVVVPTVALDATSTAQELLGEGDNISFAAAVAGETYTITVTIDDTVALGSGRYMMTVKRTL